MPADTHSPGVSGTLPAERALARLLGGSGLTWRLRASNTIMLIDPAQRLDILKGPSSVLFGQSTPGGLVNATSRRPTGEAYREVQAEVGSFGRRQATADFGGPAAGDDAFLYSFTALLRDSGTQIDHSPDDALYIAPAFTWKPDEGTALTLLTSYHEASLWLDYALQQEALAA